jgi:hypothetical protein
MPVWILAGLADYACHRAARIEDNSGTAESLLHLLQFGLVGVPVVLALFLEITAGFFLLAAGFLLAHHLTAYIDVRYADSTRKVKPLEQMVHSFLELVPLTALLLLAVLYWPQLLALGSDQADYGFRLKQLPLPPAYVASLLAATFLFNAIPYLEELARTLRRRT